MNIEGMDAAATGNCKRCRAKNWLLGLALAAVFPAQAATDLTQLSLEQLLDVSIVGASKYEQKQSEVAAAASVITRADIRTFGWRTLGEALASLPGAHLTYDRQYTYLGVRGFGLPGDYVTRVLLTINGNRLNDTVYDGSVYGREFPLDLDLIERIEFIPGPGGAVYGQNAMFGVVNVVTRTGAGVDGAEAAGAFQGPQSARDGRATWGKVLDIGLDVLLSVAGMRSHGEDLYFTYPGAAPDGSDVSGIARGMDGERNKQFFARVARRAWSFDLVYGNRRKDDPAGAYFSDPLVAGQYQRDRYVLSQLQYQNSFAANTLHVLGRVFAGNYRYTGDYSYGTRFLATASGDWRGAELRALSTAMTGHKLMIGLEAQDNSRYDQAFEDVENPANNIAIPRNGYRAGVYVQDEWQLSPSVAATLGVRVDRNNATGTHTSPRAGLIWQATAATSLKALYGRAHRAPNAYERDYDDGVSQIANPALKGEKIDTLELVADHRAARDLAVRASAYRWSMSNIITLGLDSASGLTRYQSGQDVRASGLELSFDKTWERGARLRGSGSLQRVRSADGERLTNSPRFLGRLNFSSPLRVAALRLAYELQYDSRRLTNDRSDVGGYALSNLSLVADQWARGLEVSLGIYNLFDRRYLHPAADVNWQNALEQDGRSVRLKVGYRF